MEADEMNELAELVEELEAADNVPDRFYFKCHLCGKVKEASTEWRALYVLAFHYDRRHKGWTHEEPRASVAGEAHTQ